MAAGVTLFGEGDGGLALEQVIAVLVYGDIAEE